MVAVTYTARAVGTLHPSLILSFADTIKLRRLNELSSLLDEAHGGGVARVHVVRLHPLETPLLVRYVVR